MTNPETTLDAGRPQALHDWSTHWSKHDTDGLVHLFVEDLVCEVMEEVFKASSDVRYEITHAIVSGNRGSAEVTIRGTHTGELEGVPATGRRLEVKCHSAFEFDGERIKRCSDYWSIATMAEAAWLLPS